MKRFFNLLRLARPYWFSCMLAMFFLALNLFFASTSIPAVLTLFDRVLSDGDVVLGEAHNITYWGIGEKVEALETWISEVDPLIIFHWFCIYLIIGILLKGISQICLDVTMEKVSQNIARDLRLKMFRKYYLFPVHYFSGARSGDLISKITNDVAVVQLFFSGHFAKTVQGISIVFPAVIYVFMVDPKIAFVCLVVIPACMLPIILIGRQIRKISHKGFENIADITSFIAEALSAIKIVKVFGRYGSEFNRFVGLCNKTIKIKVKSKKKEAILSPLTEMIAVLAAIYILKSMVPKVISNEISMGGLITYLGSLIFCVKPLKTFGKIQSILQSALAGLDRIDHILEEHEDPCELTGKKIELDFTSGVHFDQVTYGYDADQPVLRDISFSLKKGQVLALVGPSGSGKTTIANLLPRFFDPDSGHILIDDKPMTSVHVSSIRKLYGMVSQEPILFNVSVLDNIRYGNPGASLEDAQEAAKVARAHEFIMKMDHQYDTMTGERGVRLSGGEKQRIALARALLKDPEIFIFDEATSALDTENERLVQEAIDRVMENRTVLVIAHRLSTVVKAHQILVLDKGRIVQRGTHAELLAQKGLYKKLYEMNFQG